MYVAAEEGEHDIKLRFERLNLKSPHLVRVFPMGNHADLVETLRSRAPCATFFDSLPGFVSSPEEGLELCKALKPIAVSLDMPMIVIDHINKQDDFAGLEALQHAVDTLITLFPTGEDELREMEVVKNRNGKAHITLNMMMTETGIFPVLDEETAEDD